MSYNNYGVRRIYETQPGAFGTVRAAAPARSRSAKARRYGKKKSSGRKRRAGETPTAYALRRGRRGRSQVKRRGPSRKLKLARAKARLAVLDRAEGRRRYYAAVHEGWFVPHWRTKKPKQAKKKSARKSVKRKNVGTMPSGTRVKLDYERERTSKRKRDATYEIGNKRLRDYDRKRGTKRKRSNAGGGRKRPRNPYWD